MKFHEALIKFMEGSKIRRSSWKNKDFFLSPDQQYFGKDIFDKGFMNDLQADDWKSYKNK